MCDVNGKGLDLAKIFKEEIKFATPEESCKKYYDDAITVIVANIALLANEVEGAEDAVTRAGECFGNYYDYITNSQMAFVVAQKCCAEMMDAISSGIVHNGDPSQQGFIEAYYDANIPDNRIVTASNCEPVDTDSHFYKIFIESDCGGYAKRKQFLCYSDSPMRLMGITEAEARAKVDNATTLAKLMWHLDKSTSLSDYNLFNNVKEDPEITKLVNIAEEIATELVFPDIEGPNFDAISNLTSKGFKVYPGDEDEYGWLSGCIETPTKHILIFS